jgi:hypothetical protein
MVKDDNTEIQRGCGLVFLLCRQGNLVDDRLKTSAMHQCKSLIRGRSFDKADTLCHLNPALKYPRGAISGCFRSDAGNAIRLFCAFFSTGSGPIHPSGFISGREGR